MLANLYDAAILAGYEDDASEDLQRCKNVVIDLDEYAIVNADGSGEEKIVNHCYWPSSYTLGEWVYITYKVAVNKTGTCVCRRKL